MEALLEFLAPLIESLGGKYGWVVQVITVIGALRLAFKPLMALAQVVADHTKTEKDNEVLRKIEESKLLSTILFVIDWLTSLKLPKKKK